MKHLWYLVWFGFVGCSNAAAMDVPGQRTVDAPGASAVIAQPSASVEPPRVELLIEVVPLSPTERPVTFALRGRSRQPIVFLAGLCGHAQGYVQSFQMAAAERGTVVAPQGGDSKASSAPSCSLAAAIDKI